MNRRTSLALWFSVFSLSSAPAQTTVGWPDTIDLLTEERTQAQACVNLLKNAGNVTAVSEGRITYDAARAAADGVIAGFTTAVVEGYKPENLPRIQANLERAGAGLQEVCNDAVQAAREAVGKRGLIDQIVTAAVGPVVDALKSAAGALWTRRVEKDKLELETIKGQLEAAKWPDF
ncbi:MAG: hypothetical protein JO223_01065 [Hyphomicrobiales bacterium]|nr:hypothetical protein [Hyphomicrobiales bacterium]MBV8441265.1 hypothetical protein [Hyphomicrobiales bacterium]